jgi:hypothetical protein
MDILKATLKAVLVVALALVLITGAGYLYASSGVKSKPGYAKLEMPKGKQFDALITVNLGPGGVGPVKWLVEKISDDSDHEHDMPERVFRSVLPELQGLQLQVYDVKSDTASFEQAITASVAALKAQDWQTLLKVQEDNELVVVMQSEHDRQIEGLSILVSTPDKAVFMNLIGPFDPETIANAANQFN